MSNEEKIIKNKVRLLKLAELLGNVSQACKVMGYSRESFYRLKNSRIIAARWLCKRSAIANKSSRIMIQFRLELQS